MKKDNGMKNSDNGKRVNSPHSKCSKHTDWETEISSLFVVVVVGHVAFGILIPRPGLEPAPAALEGQNLAMGPPMRR